MQQLALDLDLKLGLIHEDTDDPEIADQAVSDLEMTSDLVAGFASVFGEYPFVEEKYGNCITPFGGGMEHQTLTSILHRLDAKAFRKAAKPLVGYSEAMAVRKGEQEMLNFLNAWIEARTADKWIDTTRNYWFETMDWVADLSKK